ncbi:MULTISPECIES: benzoate-CoA ligase family protein [Bradyrhizobium]|uniref:4-hydroxybenzoate-CoA ligase n=1 Tax=Bradyrhizobium elkanii TaxID=29448 RepID=A0A8I2BY23_BRAEL|nr:MULTISPECIES: benzoate-CoA ligase family protein [Bradyrhizobium]MBP1291485.1 4-hydroxybenzoate-CoA ligase [Bradyrhizobium elkanii]MCP1928204.1 4-hydroxybenzoate-CoA ligase [Bradyrhizobium elkanii]MCS3474400.1 4-hydroxybenzoate-CoA ligase [Bradyrhizobium elkanii]MCS3581184.1 4-hydroxybenzoate-CoA ligase [Bradyrhizobium elkanii]MCS3724059.1 4-hydroxybenzoate-CoA ligase [Bradyrhizobium elkanii]
MTYNAVSWLLDRNVDEGRGDKVVFDDTVSRITYGQLQQQTRRVGNMLRRLGVRREERVAMIMLDAVDFPIVFLGAIRAGVVPVPLNTLLTAEQYAYILGDCRARVLFVSEALLPVVKDIIARMPDLEHVVVSGKDAHGHNKLSDEIARESDVFATAPTHADEPAFWLYSSGSTGMPKGVRHLHSNLAATAETYAKQVLGIREDDVGLSAAKLFFAYGLGNALTFPMSVGATTVLNSERPTPAVMFALMNKYHPSIFFGVPTLFAAMLNDDAMKAQAAGNRLRVCTSAGEALPESVGNAWRARFGVDILDGVGSTELLHIFLSNAPGDIKYGSSGRPVPGYKVRLVNELGADVADGEVGELLVDAPSAGESYWNQRAKSRATFEGAWTRTGDKYTRDADGRYTFCGRADDMFKVSGIWVSPFEVESALITHPAVLEAAVVPEADPEGLLKPKAYVVLRPESSAAGLHEALKEHVKQKIGPWKYPRWIDVVDNLPKTATGKIQRFKLREHEH